MKNKLLHVTFTTALLIMAVCLNTFAQNASPVMIEFDKNSERIDLITGRELPDYNSVQRGSIRFFMGRLDKPENVIRYFHDGRRTAEIKNLRSMEKFQKRYAQWRLRFTKGRGDSPQYIPRIHTRAVSFIPLETSTKKAERRVYVLLDDLQLIDWGKKQ